MAEKKISTAEQLKMLALRAKADSAARIAALAALVADGYGHLITVTLKNEALLANSGYCYFVCGDADCYMDCSDTGIKADNVVTDGEVMFRCEVTPDIDLTVNILRLEVETE